MNYEQANSVKELAPGVNEVLERLDWKWQPQVGEWFFMDNPLFPTPHIVCEHMNKNPDDLEYYIPILPWEEIEKVLEKVGYFLSIVRDNIRGLWFVGIDKHYIYEGHQGNGKFRQEAVMLAVIKLGRELK